MNKLRINKQGEADGMSMTAIIILVLLGAIITLYFIINQTSVFKSVLGME